MAVFREIVTKPVGAVVALIELPGTVTTSLKQANELMESSRQQMEAMQTQTDSALAQAERMNELLSKVVKLTEPIDRAARGGEYIAGGLKRAIFGLEKAVQEVEAAEAAVVDAEIEGEGVEVTDSDSVRVTGDPKPPEGPGPTA